mgnify:CR=1 FL=1
MAALAALPACPPDGPAASPCLRSDARCDVLAPHAPCDGGALHRVRIVGASLGPDPDTATEDASVGAAIDVWRYRP